MVLFTITNKQELIAKTLDYEFLKDYVVSLASTEHCQEFSHCLVKE